MKYLAIIAILILSVINAEAARLRSPTCKTYVMATGVYVVVCNGDLKRFKQLHPKTSNANTRYIVRRGWHSRYYARLHRGGYRKYTRVHQRSYQASQRVEATRPVKPGQSYLIAFSGLGGAIDKASAQKIADSKNSKLVVFNYWQTNQAASFVKSNKEPYSILGFSAGASASVLRSFINSVGKLLPENIVTVGLYRGSATYNNNSIPTIHYLDSSGQSHIGERNVVNLGSTTSHLDPIKGAMAKVASLFQPVLKQQIIADNDIYIPPEIAASIMNEVMPTDKIIAEARSYLIQTAHPGGTMTRQTPQVAINKLHPVFAVRLARAVKQARNEGIAAGLMSAYRPPVFGVGGFRDKFNSLHSYGLATDMGGIGGPGSSAALRWFKIAAENGIYGPYGPYNGAEWNHYQLVPLLSVTAGNPLRRTITGQGPISTALMWLASGVGLTSIAPAAIKPVLIAVRARRYHRVYYARHYYRHRYVRLARHG